MVIPGSHKSNFVHPDFAKYQMGTEIGAVDGMEGAVEVHLKAGDSLLFVDAISHGSAKRVNVGFRRICVYRYGPSWGNFRHGYRPSAALLELVYTTPTPPSIALAVTPPGALGEGSPGSSEARQGQRLHRVHLQAEGAQRPRAAGG